MINLYTLRTRKLSFVLGIVCFSITIFHLNATTSLSSLQNQALTNHKDSVYAIVEQMPQFPGGDVALFNYIGQVIQYPVEAQQKHQQGRVIVQIVIDKIGKTTCVKVVKGVSQSLDSEALRVVNSLPPWIPGKNNGENVSVYRIIPINFRMSADQDNPETGVIDELHKTFKLNDNAIVVYNGKQMKNGFVLSDLNSKDIQSIAVIVPSNAQIIAKLQAQYGDDAQNGVILIDQTGNQQKVKMNSKNHPISIQDDNYIFILAAKMPKYPGGLIGIGNFIRSHIHYPDSAREHGIDGRVDVRFMIDKLGNVRNAHVDEQVNPILAAEAIRVVNSFPKWIPGQQNGINVNVLQTIPIDFSAKIDSSLLNGPYVIVEKMPKFLGGNVNEFLAKNIRYPVVAEENHIQGIVIVQFIINKEGNVENPRVLRSPHDLLSQEALRVVNLTKWIPGEQKGEKVDVKYTLPVNFRLN